MTPSRERRDIVPWTILLIVGLALAGAVALKGRGEERLAERTRQTGAPLTREQRSVRFETADLTFEVMPERQEINGIARLGFAVLSPIERIQFDLDPRFDIGAIKADGQAVARDRWRNREGLVTVELAAPKKAGSRLLLTVDYGGRPHVAERPPWDGGFVWRRTRDGRPWVATAVQGEGCDLFWPCFDNSEVEVGTVTMRIIVPEGLAAPANGRLLAVDKLADGRSRWTWQARSPNNYAISLNVAPYKRLSAVHRSRFGNSIPLQFWYLPGDETKARVLFAEFAPTVDFFEAMIGPYPFADEKVGAVVTPHLGMEHQTLNAYGNNYKAAPEGYDWLFNHEFAHEWFGNQLTNRDWDDMWLHEGFGSYMQPLYLEWRRGRMAYQAALFKQRQQILNRRPMTTGRSRLSHIVYSPETGPGSDIYYKGSWILHTLRGQIGDDAFFRSVRRLVYGRPDPRPGNFRPRFGTSAEFQRIVSQEARRDMGWLFDVYLRRAPLPRLVETRRATHLDLQWRTPGGLPFPMPVEVRINGDTRIVPMADGRGSVPLPKSGSLVTVDPDNKLLRQQDEIDRFRDEEARARVKASR